MCVHTPGEVDKIHCSALIAAAVKFDGHLRTIFKVITKKIFDLLFVDTVYKFVAILVHYDNDCYTKQLT